MALKYGADALWVSNDGGKTFDSAPSSISVLPSIVRAVRSIKSAKPNAEIYIDGGIRRGTEVIKALAYGAQAVFIGRPVIWSLHCGGKEGVKEMLEILNEELKICMALTHCMDIKEITAEKVIHMVKPKL